MTRVCLKAARARTLHSHGSAFAAPCGGGRIAVCLPVGEGEDGAMAGVLRSLSD